VSVWKSAPPPDPRITDTEPDRLAPLAPLAPMALRGVWVVAALLRRPKGWPRLHLQSLIAEGS
jgi:hypothetical protein